MFEESVQVVAFCTYYFGMDAKVGTDLGSYAVWQFYTHAVWQFYWGGHACMLIMLSALCIWSVWQGELALYV